MHAILAAFPRRPLTLRPPQGLLGTFSWMIAMLAFAGGIYAWLALGVWPGIASDFAIRDSAVPLANGRIVDGRCSTRLALFQDCEATLVVPLKQGEARRKVEALFVTPHVGSWSATVVADPQRPELATTDIALDRLWNRVATAGGFALFGLVILFGGWAMTRDRLRARSRFRALSGQVLTPVALAFRGGGRGSWQLADAAGHDWQISVPGKARPFVVEPQRGLVLGVTAPGAQPVPLDEKLRWIDLTAPERAAMLEARG